MVQGSERIPLHASGGVWMARDIICVSHKNVQVSIYNTKTSSILNMKISYSTIFEHF